MQQSILILKKERQVASFIAEWLTEKRFRIIGHTDQWGEAIRLSRLHQPDIAIIDRTITGGDGMEIARIIKKESPKSHCIVCLTENDPGPNSRKAVNISGYLSLNHNLNELLQCINDLANGYQYLSTDVYQKIFSRPESLFEESNIGELSRMEVKVLTMIGNGLTNKCIAETLFISMNTLSNHKSNIKRKLNFKHNQELLLSAKSLLSQLSKST